jgi:chromosome segregation ATPase
MSDTSRHIEIADRGVTLSKSLAWVVMVGLVTGGLYVGTTLGRLETAMEQLKESRTEFQVDIRRDLTGLETRKANAETRLRILEVGAAQEQARLQSIGQTLERIDNRLTAIDNRLRQTERNGAP